MSWTRWCRGKPADEAVTAGQTGTSIPATDSLKTEPSGGLVLTDSAGGRFTTIGNVGTAAQRVSSTAIGFGGAALTSLDDVL